MDEVKIGIVGLGNVGSSTLAILALTFGLGSDTTATSVEIQWPSGALQKLGNVKGDQHLTIQEQ